jgi:hypothetical protein
MAKFEKYLDGWEHGRADSDEGAMPLSQVEVWKAGALRASWCGDGEAIDYFYGRFKRECEAGIKRHSRHSRTVELLRAELRDYSPPEPRQDAESVDEVMERSDMADSIQSGRMSMDDAKAKILRDVQSAHEKKGFFGKLFG